MTRRGVASLRGDSRQWMSCMTVENMKKHSRCVHEICVCVCLYMFVCLCVQRSHSRQWMSCMTVENMKRHSWCVHDVCVCVCTRIWENKGLVCAQSMTHAFVIVPTFIYTHASNNAFLDLADSLTPSYEFRIQTYTGLQQHISRPCRVSDTLIRIPHTYIHTYIHTQASNNTSLDLAESQTPSFEFRINLLNEQLFSTDGKQACLRMSLSSESEY